jgi:hypothetical protein
MAPAPAELDCNHQLFSSPQLAEYAAISSEIHLRVESLFSSATHFRRANQPAVCRMILAIL